MSLKVNLKYFKTRLTRNSWNFLKFLKLIKNNNPHIIRFINRIYNNSFKLIIKSKYFLIQKIDYYLI